MTGPIKASELVEVLGVKFAPRVGRKVLALPALSRLSVSPTTETTRPRG
jgi:hypothetical protein